MPCYHPMLARPQSISANTGKVQYKFIGQLQSVGELSEVVQLGDDYYPMKALPCGKCIGCRLDYSREWATRCALELLDYDINECYFVTLTYDEDHCPLRLYPSVIPEDLESWYIDNFFNGAEYDSDLLGGIQTYKRADVDLLKGFGVTFATSRSLEPEHLTKFVKDLRRYQEYHYGKQFRFFACGEYGTKSQRPHYHMIIYGLKLQKPSPDTWRKQMNGYVLFESKELEKVWKRGNVIVGSVTYQSISYVARYMLKKQKGQDVKFYRTFNLAPEFSRMSRMPGIGSKYYRDHVDDIYEYDQINISLQDRGLSCKPPRYFDDLATEEFPDLMEQIKVEREDASINAMIAKELVSGLDISEILAKAEQIRKSKTKILQNRGKPDEAY